MLFPVWAFGFTTVSFPPDKMIKLSNVSDSIFLIEATDATWKPAEEKNGLERRELVISGKIMEVLRGTAQNKVFSHTCEDFRITDAAAFTKVYGKGAADTFGSTASVQTGAAEVKSGTRYLVIEVLKKAYFVPIVPGDESWRSKILPLDPSFAPRGLPGS